MKAKVKSKEMEKKVQIAALAATGKITGQGAEIYTCLRVTAKGKKIEAVGMGPEITIIKTMGAEVTEEGSSAVKAKILADSVAFCKEEDATLEVAAKKMRVKSGSFKIDLAYLPADEFPAPPIEEVEKAIAINVNHLRSMVRAALPSTAADEHRPALSGVLFRTDQAEGREGELVLASTDGYRLAETKMTVSIPKGMEKINAILPGDALEKLDRALEGDGLVSVGVTAKGKVQFWTADTVVTVNTLSGAFPDYTPIIPEKYATIVSFAVKELLEGLKSGQLIGLQGYLQMKPGDKGKGNVILDVESETGHVETKIDAMLQGEPQEICVNLAYLRDAIAGCERLGNDGVYITTVGRESPLLVMPAGEAEDKRPTARFIVMPADGKRKKKEETAMEGEGAAAPAPAAA